MVGKKQREGEHKREKGGGGEERERKRQSDRQRERTHLWGLFFFFSRSNKVFNEFPPQVEQSVESNGTSMSKEKQYAAVTCGVLEF